MKLWIARDIRGELYLYSEKPIKENLYGYFTADNWFEIDSHLFPSVTFENSPQQVEIKLIEK